MDVPTAAADHEVVRAGRSLLLAARRMLAPISEEHAALIRAGNLRRLPTTSALAAALGAVLVTTFLVMPTSDPTTARWRAWLLVCHATLLLVSLITWLAVRPARRPPVEVRTGCRILRVQVVAVLAYGVGVASVDQLVTSSITPFMLVTLAVVLTVLQPPKVAAALLAGATVALTVGMAAFQSEHTVVVSNIVNGVSIALIALLIAGLRWWSELEALTLRDALAAKQAELEERNQELAHLASYDELTLLLNRRGLLMLLEHELARLRRTRAPACLLLLDLDRFKLVNDDHGHAVGDRVLAQVAQVLSTRLRASDLAARWGGEEFLVVLPDTDLDGARELAETQRAAIAASKVRHDDTTLRVTVSIGVAVLDPGGPDPLGTALRDADEALYEAKRTGRDRVVVSDAG